MTLIDSHAHIYLEHFKSDIDEIIESARDSDVEKILMPNIDDTSIDDMLELANRYPGVCYPMIGLHPCSVNKEFEKQLYKVEDWLKHEKFIAVGEMGTDLYWDKTFWEQQKEAFKIQIELAKSNNLPFVIHCRDSIDETIELIEPFNNNDLSGVFHCFAGTLEQAKRITEMGFYLGIGGVATFKNGGLEPVLKEIDLDKIVLETDSPYLAPTPHRGKRNEPAYVKLVAQKVSDVREHGIDETAGATTSNCIKLFKLDS